jgi:hypothetical protein
MTSPKAVSHDRPLVAGLRRSASQVSASCKPSFERNRVLFDLLPVFVWEQRRCGFIIVRQKLRKLFAVLRHESIAESFAILAFREHVEDLSYDLAIGVDALFVAA